MFTHLRVQSGYSFYNSTITIDKLIQKAKSLKVHTLSLTDEGVLYGAIAFYRACKSNGIHPILGLSMHVTLHDTEKMGIVLLAKNNQGYKNLLYLSTVYQTENGCSFDVLKSYVEGLICIIPADNPSIKQQLLEESYTNLYALFTPFIDIFERDDIYVGVAYYDYTDEILIENAVTFGERHQLKPVALQDVRYLEEHDFESYDCLQAMKYGEKWQGYTGKKHIKGRHFASEGEMMGRFAAWPSLFTHLSDIISRCHFTLDFEQRLLPAYPAPTEENAHTYLRRLCEKSLPKKYPTQQPEAWNRMDRELDIIETLGFSDYFLIVGDFVDFANEENIATGPGRGSAAGSIVAYLLGITNVDPLKYGLLFERFLNPERITMPDIDIDFSDTRRDEVIHYVREKYGKSHVAQIITFGTFLARSILRELMKTMDIDRRDQAFILKQLPKQSSEPLLSLIKQSTSLMDYIKQSDKLRLLFKVGLKLEGLPRHMSTHAAGIIIGKAPLIEEVPLTVGADDTYLTQYAMNELEAIGLLKIDILGLRNLSLLENITKTVAKRENKVIDLTHLPEQDAATFRLLQQGRTNGVFQLESLGMKRVLRALQPSSLDDIVAVNALYRPGPMEQIQVYIDRKHGMRPITYVHPDLVPILAPTYGVLIYQEQIMQITHQFAGLSLGAADMLRRAISKKDRTLIEEQKAMFIKGCNEKGYDPAIAEEVFSWIVQFANYGFNKSHAVAYSKISYQLSYLKAHYPAAFFAHFLGQTQNDPEKLPIYMKEAEEIGLKVLPPDINQSHAYYTVEKADQLRMGLLSIKGIGYETAKEIVAKRVDKRYTDVFDFCLRAHIKRNHLETLILAGTFDGTHPNRASLLASLDQAYANAELFGDIGNNDLFKSEMKMSPSYIKIADFSLMDKLRDEKELMHIYVSNHPLQPYRRKLSLVQYQSLKQVEQTPLNKIVETIVIMEKVKKVHTKTGESMAFMTVSDETGEMEVVIFPAVYREVHPFLKESEMIQLNGKTSLRNHRQQLIANQIMAINMNDVVKNIQSHIYIKVQPDKNNQEVLHFLKQLATRYSGEAGILLYHAKEKKTYKLGHPYFIREDEEVLKELETHFGSENVVLTK